MENILIKFWMFGYGCVLQQLKKMQAIYPNKNF
jgi:hypothetical protein